MKSLMLSLLLPLDAQAHQTDVLPTPYMVWLEGVWHVPTPETALLALMAQHGARSAPAVAVLRQVFDARPAAELDTFAAELARILRDGTSAQSYRASIALMLSAHKYPDDDSDTPYAGAVHALVRLYESFEGHSHPRAVDALYGIFYAGGTDYVRNLFKASEKPSKPCFQTPSAIVRVPAEDPPQREEWCPHKSV